MRELYFSAFLGVFGLIVPGVFATPVVDNPGFEDTTDPSMSAGQVLYTDPYGASASAELKSVPDWTFGPSACRDIPNFL